MFKLFIFTLGLENWIRLFSLFKGLGLIFRECQQILNNFLLFFLLRINRLILIDNNRVWNNKRKRKRKKCVCSVVFIWRQWENLTDKMIWKTNYIFITLLLIYADKIDLCFTKIISVVVKFYKRTPHQI